MNEQGIINEIKLLFNTVVSGIDLLFEKPITWLINIFKRFFSVLMILSFLVALDFVFRWTDHFEEERKLDRIQKINLILEKKNLDLNVIQSLKTLQNQVLSEKNYKDYLNNYFEELSEIPANISSSNFSEYMNNTVAIFFIIY